MLSNLFFDGASHLKPADGNNSAAVKERPEISLLKLVLQRLKKGGRGAIIVKDYILSNYLEEIKTIRREIIENHKLQAVISLSNAAGSLFSGAAILIFSDAGSGTTDKVWFCKMKSFISINESCPTGLSEAINEVYNEMNNIIRRWKNLAGEYTRMRTENSFYVTVDEIKSNNFSLSFNDYKKIEKLTPLCAASEISKIKNDVINYIPKAKSIKPDFTPLKDTYARIGPAVKKVLQVTRAQIQMLIEKKLSQLQLHVPVRFFIKRVSTGLIPPVLISLVVLIFFLIFINSYDTPLIKAAKTYKLPVEKKTGDAASKIVNRTNATVMLSPEQIKSIVYDTTGIIHFDEQTAPDIPVSLEDSIDAVIADDDMVINRISSIKNASETFRPVRLAKYAVRDTAFFHNHPDEHSGRKTYLDPLKKSILEPIDEKNGFIYIVYTNQFGRTSKGWINKKDLVPLR